MMKKFLLSLALVAMAGVASAQITFERIINHQPAGAVEPGRYEIVGNVDDMQELSFAMNVINNGSESVSVTCEREVIAITEGAGNNFCFGGCFPDETSSTEVTIEPISSMDPNNPYYPYEFSAHFKPYDPMTWELMPEGAELTVQYTFTERGGEPMTFEFYFRYETNSVEENLSNMLSNAYPNPASNFVNFDVEMQNAQSASIAIYNMMGQEVVRQDINDSHVSINVSDLTDGIYFYSLIVNNETVKTNKLVVRK